MPNTKVQASRSVIARSWMVHAFTSLGIMCGFLTIHYSLTNHPNIALLWLMLAQVLDGIDGPLARHYKINKHVPVLDGNILDLITDYITCVFAPIIFAWHFELIPDPWALPLFSLILMSSAIWFSRRDIETNDMWFRGFPTAWNLVFTMLWVTKPPVAFSVGISIILIVLTLMPWYKFPHILSSQQFRRTTISLSVMGLGFMTLLILDPNSSARPFALAAIGLWTLYYFMIGLWRSLQGDELPGYAH